MCGHVFLVEEQAQGWIVVQRKPQKNHFIDELYIKDITCCNMHTPQKLLAVIFWGDCFDAAGLVTQAGTVISVGHGSIQTGIFGGAFPGYCSNPALLCALGRDMKLLGSSSGELFFISSLSWGMIPLRKNGFWLFWGFFSLFLISELRIHLTFLGWVFGSLCIIKYGRVRHSNHRSWIYTQNKTLQVFPLLWKAGLLLPRK